MQEINQNNEIQKLPLCVDLDGTLIKSDAIFESLLQLLKSNPLYFFVIPFWLLKGRPHLKDEIDKRIDFRVENLPYNEELIEYMEAEKSKGRKIYLATASHISIANKIAEHLGIFDGVFATQNGYNLKSENKASVLNEEFGQKGYVYAGNSTADYKVWESSESAIVVNNKKLFIRNVTSKYNVEKSFLNEVNFIKLIIKEIRVYQWVKNLLLFLPILLAHSLSNLVAFSDVVIGFFAFGFSASFVYVLNDLLDLESDRNHPRKRKRPLASGNLPIQIGIFLVPILLIIGLGLSFLLNDRFQMILCTYIILTTAYSFSLKKIPMLDIIILAALFTSRIVAGAFSANVYLSMWILAFSMFFFMNLAVLKRYAELLVMKKNNKSEAKGRGYTVEDMGLLLSIGPSAGFLSVLIFVLYLNSSQAMELYSKTYLLWLISPIFLYWIARIWHLCVRGQMTDDPIVFTVKDRASYIIGILIFIIVFLAS